MNKNIWSQVTEHLTYRGLKKKGLLFIHIEKSRIDDIYTHISLVLMVLTS